MSETRDNPKRTLSHLKRLTRDGLSLVEQRPLDEMAHAYWLERAERYLKRKMPEVHVPTASELIPTRMPNLLSAAYKPPHPLDAAMSRSQKGQRLIQKMLGIIASAIERLELRIETEGC